MISFTRQYKTTRQH